MLVSAIRCQPVTFVDANGSSQDLYLRDLQQGLTKLVSSSQSGTSGANGVVNASNLHYLISSDSSTFVFDGDASNLFPNDINFQRDVFATSTTGYSTIRGQVFNDANKNGSRDGSETGLQYWTIYLDANGNGLLDLGEKSVITDSSGNYALSDLLPGTYTIAIVSQTGWQKTLPASTYSVTIATDGTITSGKNFGEALPLPDLAAGSVTFSPASGAPGQLVNVSWNVSNQGSAVAAGAWQDAVYLSATPTLTADAQLVATVPHFNGLAVGAQYVGNAQIALPATVGTWYVIVRTDQRSQLNEGQFGANRVNNTAASAATLSVSIPQLAIGTPASDQLTAAGSDRYFQLTATSGHSLLVTLSSAAASGQLELYIKRGALPTDYDFDFAAKTIGQPGQVLTVPQIQAGTYFVLVRGISGAALSSSFTLTATQPGLTLQSLGLTSAGNGGLVTLPILGTDLQPNTPITLTFSNITLMPTAVDYRDPSFLYATFNMAGQPSGTWTLHVGNGNQSASLDVTPARGPDLQVHLATPSGIRINHPYGDIIVSYENDGDTDMPAPVFQMATNLGTLQLLAGGQLQGFAANTLQFVGIGEDSPGGILRAGDKGQVKMRLTVPVLIISGGGGSGSGGSNSIGWSQDSVSITLNTLATDTTPIDWNSLKAQLQPPTVPDDAWDVVFNNFTSAVGATAGQLQSSVVADTAYLNQVGVSNPTFSQIMAFEMLKADAALPLPTLDSEVDAAFPAPGLSLDFGRQFYQSISGRYRLGTLGRGWVSNWDISATTDANGDVRVYFAGVPRDFTKQADGTFLALPGDHGTLTLVGNAYQLREVDGTITRFRADGKLGYVQDTNGNRITAGYNGAGQLVSLTHSDGQALTIAYNAQGRISTVTDPANRIAVYTYDASGEHLLGVQTAAGATQYSYVTGQGAAREHALASIVTPDGVQSNFTYDAQGRLSGSFLGTPASPINPVTISYPSSGGVTFTNAAGTSTIEFNNAGQPAVVIDPLGRSVSATYDANHNLTQILLPGGSTYSYTFDVHGNMTGMTDALGLSTSFTYDSSLSTLTSFTDPRGNTTRYNHDADGNLLAITYPDGSHENFTYDPLGNLIDSTNRRGHAIAYTYNAVGQVTRTTFADASHLDYTYDAHGNLATAADGSGMTTFQYDGADRLTLVTYPGGQFLQFTYNARGQRIQSVDQTGYTINYIYDAAGRLGALKDGASAPIVDYTYDDAGRLIQKDLGNGTRTTYAYDAAGQLLHLVNLAPDHVTVNSRFDYTYDDLGRVATQSNSDGAWVYTYDADSQLLHAVFTSNDTNVLPNQDMQYVYDAAGNRTQTIINGVTTNYAVNNLNEYTLVGTTIYTYDLDGNLATMTDGGVTTTYTSDDLNRLTGVSSPGDTFSYGFDAIGQLASTTHNGTTTSYLNDPTGFGNITGLGTLMGEFNGASTIAHYAWGLGLVSRTDASGPAYYDFDMLGSTAGITNAAGSYVNRYSYLPFLAATSSAAALPNPFTSVGEFGVRNDGNGLLGMGFRQYQAGTGQFSSYDPIGLAGGSINTRSYVANNPLSLVDPAGLNPLDDLDAMQRQYPTLNPAEGDWSRFNDHDPGQYGKTEPFLLPPTSEKERQDKGFHRDYVYDAWTLAHIRKATRVRHIRSQLDETLVEGIKKKLNGVNPFGDSPSTNPTFRKLVPLLGSGDPNEMVGPAGVGAQNWVSADLQPLPYTIQFENDPKLANAAAQDVTVTEQLDANLDWSTFQLGNIQFGSTIVTVPAGLRHFATTVMTTNVDATPLRVDIAAAFDPDTGIITWTFRSLDPVTGLASENPIAGFLPVDDDTHRGEGFVSYTVRAKSQLPTGTQIRAVANIVFDTNASIATNQVNPQNPGQGTDPAKEALITIDAGAPTSSVSPLPPTSGTTFAVHWSGQDDAGGSGGGSFDIYVSDNGADFALWQTTALTTANFSGQIGHTYRFYSVATDNVGHKESKTAGAETQTRTPVFQQTLPAILEDATAPANVRVSDLLNHHFTDANSNARPGIAVVQADGNGVWQFSANGITWTNLGTVSNGQARLLSSTYRIRFLPARDADGSAQLLYYAWDGSIGTAGRVMPIPGTGGANAFSVDAGLVSEQVNPVNDAPTWTAAALNDSAVAGGKSISAIASSLFHDIDGNSFAGVAVVGVTGAGGTWQFSRDGGTTWTNFGAVSPRAARVLGPADLVHFLPPAAFTGNATLQLRAWDGATGTAGAVVNLSTAGAAGGTSAYSAGILKVTVANAAPTISKAIGPAIVVKEDVTSAAVKVTTLLSATTVTDTNAQALKGIAIVGATGPGMWQYSLNGTTWFNIGTISESLGLLLPSTAAGAVRFVPAANQSGSGSLTFRAWDQTAGAAGELAPINASGGTTPFSSAETVSTLTVTPINDAPTWTTTALNDPTVAAGEAIGAIAGAVFSDIESPSMAGVAVVGLTGTGGTWQFSRDGGTTWTNFGAVSASAARILSAADLVHFLPPVGFTGNAALQLRAWDGSTGSAGTVVNLSTAGKTGGASAYNAAILKVTAVNAAPTLGKTTATAFATNEDTVSAAVTITSLLTAAVAADTNANALKGIAIVGATGPGTWEYTLNGTTWFAVGPVSETQARLLPSTTAARMRFTPAANQNGAGTLTFRAWDQTAGSAGDLGPISATGGSTAFSATEAATSLTVASVNDAPVLNTAVQPFLTPMLPGISNTQGDVIADVLAGAITDADVGALQGIAITGLTGTTTGFWQYSLDNGGNWQAIDAVSTKSALLLRDTDRVRYVPNAGFVGAASFLFKAWDRTTGSAGARATNVTSSAFSNSLGVATVLIDNAPVLA